MWSGLSKETYRCVMKCAAETIFSFRGRNVSSSTQTVNQIGSSFA